MLARAVWKRYLCVQTNKTKPNQNLTSQESHSRQNKRQRKRCPEIKNQVARVPQKDGKVMPRNQKPNSINTKRDFPAPLDLGPGRVNVSNLFQFWYCLKVYQKRLREFCQENTLVIANTAAFFSSDMVSNNFLLLETISEKANIVLPRGCTGHSKHPLPTTQEKALHMDYSSWSTPKSDWLNP